MQGSFPPHCPTESTHHRLIQFVKAALINIFVPPYATVCDLYCGKVPDEEKWDGAQIGHYIGIGNSLTITHLLFCIDMLGLRYLQRGVSEQRILTGGSVLIDYLPGDVVTSGVSDVREAWESQRKAYTSEFLLFDPCIEDVDLHWKNKENQVDIVFCMQHLPLCVETEEKLKRLLHNVSSLLKPGGYFLGITPDSSTIWAKYQKNVEAYHNKGGGTKPNIFPNSIRSESYMITFEVEEEKFPFFGKKYQLKFSGDMSSETHCLVHFPSLIRLARESGIDFIEIQNLPEFYDDNRAQLAGMLADACHNLVDQRGRLLPRSYDVLGLYTTFIFQKPDPDIAPPRMTPFLEDGIRNHDEASLMAPKDRPAATWREDEKNVQPQSSSGLAKITEQKGILGPGPAELRFLDAL